MKYVTLAAMPDLFALVVGIDRYPDPIPTLQGCVNDAQAFGGILTDQYKVPRGQVLTLIDAQATREAVIRGFREHLSKAGAGDIAVFFFAGHGAQEPTSGCYLPVEPDGKNETLVCHDSRQPGGWDLVDKDVAVLIEEIAARGARLTLILDSCHSGSADRALDEVGASGIPPGVRRVADRAEGQPDSVYLRPPAEFAASLRNLDAAAKASAGASQALGFVRGAAGAHVLFAACSDFQNANEFRTVTPRHGAFSYCLLQVLQDGKPIGNEELYQRTRILLRGLFPDQVPHLVVVGDNDLRASQFLGTATIRRANLYMARCDQGSWKIDGGALHSLHAGDSLALYPADAGASDLADRSKALAAANILTIEPSESTIAVIDAAKLNAQQNYKVVVMDRAGRMAIGLDGDPAALVPLRAALASSTWVQEGTPPRLTVHAESSRLRIAMPDSTRAVPGPFDATPQGISATVEALEHMARWIACLDLTNPSSQIAVEAVDVAVSYYDIGNKFRGQYVPPLDTLNLQYRNGAAPKFRMRVTNRGAKDIYVAVLACSGDWGITTDLLAEESTILNPTQELFAADGDDIPMELEPDETESHDHIVVVISNEWFDASVFALPSLTGSTPGTRGFGARQAPTAVPGDFATRHLEIVTRR